MTLPRIMVAPNGAHKSKADHPQLPTSIEEIVETALACKNAGADGLHAHVRDGAGKHVLDAGLYRELLDECDVRLPGFYVQITTEAVGMYSSAQQDAVVRALKPDAVSVALGEMAQSGDEVLARNFYHWADEAGIELQHILYSDAEIDQLVACRKRGIIPPGKPCMLLVLGRHSKGQQSVREDLHPFLCALDRNFGATDTIDWAICAFGRGETDCLVYGAKSGGKVRVGFENNLWNRDGSLANDNAERVKKVIKLLNN